MKLRMKGHFSAVAVGLAALCLAPASFSQTARPLSAFFGLDNGLPVAANRICQDAAGPPQSRTVCPRAPRRGE